MLLKFFIRKVNAELLKAGQKKLQLAEYNIGDNIHNDVFSRDIAFLYFVTSK